MDSFVWLTDGQIHSTVTDFARFRGQSTWNTKQEVITRFILPQEGSRFCDVTMTWNPRRFAGYETILLLPVYLPVFTSLVCQHLLYDAIMFCFNSNSAFTSLFTITITIYLLGYETRHIKRRPLNSLSVRQIVIGHRMIRRKTEGKVSVMSNENL